MSVLSQTLSVALCKLAAMPAYTVERHPTNGQDVPYELMPDGTKRWASQDEYNLWRKLVSRSNQRQVDQLQREQGVGDEFIDHKLPEAPNARDNVVQYMRGGAFDIPDKPVVWDRGQAVPISEEEYARNQRIARASGARRRERYEGQQREALDAKRDSDFYEAEATRNQLTAALAQNQQQAGQMAYYASRGLQLPQSVSQAGQAVAKAITPWFKQKQTGVTSNAPAKPAQPLQAPTQGVSSNRKPGQTGIGQT